MNEIIRKLEQQATETVRCGLNGSSTAESFNRKKFAQLIVQECLTFIRPNSYFQAYPNNMIGGEDGVRLLETITNQIEQHFGVK